MNPSQPFFSTPWRKVLRDLWMNRSRTLLVVIAIAIGVMSFGAILITRDVLTENITTGYQATRPATIEMTISPFDEDLVRVVQSYREVQTAQGQASLPARFLTPLGAEGFIPLTLYGFGDFADLRVNRITPQAGAPIPARREVLLERTSLTYGALAVGDAIEIELPDGDRYPLTVVGAVHDLSVEPAYQWREMSGYVSLETLDWLSGSRLYGRMSIITRPDYATLNDVEAVALDLKARLEDAGYTVHSVRSSRPGEHRITDIMKGMSGFMYTIGLSGLVLSALLVWNTVSAVLLQHRRQIGVMRAIGGGRTRIAAMYLSMVGVYGVAAFALALPLGILASLGYLNTAMTWLNFDLLNYRVPPVVTLTMLAAAVGTPLLASLLTIHRATRVTIREALTDYGLSLEGGAAGFENWLARLRFLPRPVALSLRNTFRQRERLVVTLGTLALAGAMLIGVLGFRQSLNVEAESGMQMNRQALTLSLDRPLLVATAERESLRLPGVTAVEGRVSTAVSRIRPDDTQGSSFTVIGLTPDSPFVEPVLLEGRWLRPGDDQAIVLSSVLLRDEPGIHPGDTITLKMGDLRRDWTVVGIYRGTWGLAAYAPYGSLSALLGLDQMATTLAVSTASGDVETQEALAVALEDRLDKVGVEVTRWDTYAANLQDIQGQFIVLVLISLIIALFLAVVGGLGLGGAIGLNVMERTREIGVMRGIGASSATIRQIVLTEGLLVGFISWVVGVILAIPVSWGLEQLVGSFMLRRAMIFTYSLPAALAWLPIVMLIAALASLFPAQRAARITVREALAYE